MADTLSVGPDGTFHTIADAVAASHAGDTIDITAGTYTNDWAQIDHDLTLVGVGGMAHIDSTAPIDNGKAELVTNGNVTIENMEFSGATVGDNNGAGIRHESGSLTVINSSFHDNQEGILAGDNPDSSISVQGSSFIHNGVGDGQTHGLYAGQIASLTVDGSTFADQVDGNQLKSRAAETTVSNSHFTTGPDGANYDIDLPNGGVATIHDNTFDKQDGTNNPAIIHFGGEIDNPVGNLTVTHNSFSADIDNATAVLNQTDLPVTMTDNSVSGIVNVELGGFASLANNVIGGVLDPAVSDSSSAPTTAVVADPTTDTGLPSDPTVTDTSSSAADSTPVDTIDTSVVASDPSSSGADPIVVDTTPVDTTSVDTAGSTDGFDYSALLQDASDGYYGDGTPVGLVADSFWHPQWYA